MTEQSGPATGTTTPPATGTTTPPATGTPAPPATGTETGGGTDWQAEAERFRAEARKWEDRSKANAGAAKELDKVRRDAMNDQERAVAEAVDAARAATAAEVTARLGSQLVSAEVRAAAAGRLGPEQLDVLVGQLNVTGFLTDAGDVDRAAVAKFVDGIAPPAETTATATFPDLGQGARGGVSQSPLNGDPLLRDVKSKLGIR